MKEKILKHKTVIISCSVFVLCLFFLCGALFMIFSDKKPVTSKKINADGIDIDFMVHGLDGTKPDEYSSVKTNNNPLFNYEKWEEGFIAIRKLKIVSSHNEPVKYNVKVTALPIKGRKSSLSLSELSKKIEVYRVICKTEEDLPDVTEQDVSMLEYVGTLTDVLGKGSTVFYNTLTPGENNEEYAIVALRMKNDDEIKEESIAVANCFDLSLYAFSLNE